MAPLIDAAIGAIDVGAIVGAIIIVAIAIDYVWQIHNGSWYPSAGVASTQDLENFIASAWGWVTGLLNTIAQGLTVAMGWVVGLIASPFVSLINAIRYSWLPWVENQAEQFATTITAGAETALLVTIGSVEAGFSAALNGLGSALYSAIGAVENAFQGEITQVWNGIDTVEQDLDQALQGVEQGINTELSALENALEISLQNLEQGFTAELNDVEQGASAAIGAVEGALGGAISSVDNKVDGLYNSILAPAIAALGVGLGALEASVAQTNAECVDPLCNNLGGLSTALGLLESLGLDGLILAIIAECVSNPQGVVDEIGNIVVAPVQDAFNAIADVTGLQQQQAA